MKQPGAAGAELALCCVPFPETARLAPAPCPSATCQRGREGPIGAGRAVSRSGDARCLRLGPDGPGLPGRPAWCLDSAGFPTALYPPPQGPPQAGSSDPSAHTWQSWG